MGKLGLTYIRAIIHWVWLLFFTIFSIVIIVFFSWLGCKKQSHKAHRMWAFGLLNVAGIKVLSKNVDKIPNEPFVMMFNHRSYVDILALFQATKKVFYFGSKKSLFSIPLLGFAMKQAGHILIQRQNPRDTLRLYRSLSHRIKTGDSFALAPEGGRHTGPTLARFKKGPFLFALQHQIWILPVIIHGAQECMPKGSWFFNTGAFRREVIVEYLDPISTKGLNKSHIMELKNKVYNLMNNF